MARLPRQMLAFQSWKQRCQWSNSHFEGFLWEVTWEYWWEICPSRDLRSKQSKTNSEQFFTSSPNSTLCKLVTTFNSVHPPAIPVLQKTGGKGKRGKVHFPFESLVKKYSCNFYYYHLCILYNSEADSSLPNKFNLQSYTTSTHKWK